MEERLPTVEEVVEELKRKPLVDLWPTLAVAYGVSKTPVGDPNFVCVRILVTRSRPKFLKKHPGAFSKIGSL
jgi:hypothetical protein